MRRSRPGGWRRRPRTYCRASSIPKVYSCEPARLFLRNIFSSVVLDTTVVKCSKPEWINGLIVSLLEDGEPELMNAIDAGMSGEGAAAQGNGDGKGHRRRVSKAEEAMEEAMREAQRLNQLIAEEDARRLSGVQGPEAAESSDPRASSESPVEAKSNGPFTSFDQLVPSAAPTALQDSAAAERVPLTLHNASVSIFDDSAPTDKGTVRSKPAIEYMLQIEPASSQHPGWMIARRYADFERVHEVLRRISVVSGVTGFAQQHAELPGWKGRTKAALREDLERYLADALRYKQLAESEGMKRFLEKDQGQSQGRASTATAKGGFPGIGSFETMGKGMIDALASAPKGAAGGGKALLGGVSGVLGGVGVGGIGQKKGRAGDGVGAPSNASEVSLPGHGAPPLRESRDSFGLPSQNTTPIIERDSFGLPDRARTAYKGEAEATSVDRAPRTSMNGVSSDCRAPLGRQAGAQPLEQRPAPPAAAQRHLGRLRGAAVAAVDDTVLDELAAAGGARQQGGQRQARADGARDARGG